MDSHRKKIQKKLFDVLESGEYGSIYQIALDCKIDTSNFYKAKSGNYGLSIEAINKICKRYKIDIEFIPQGKKNKIDLVIVTLCDKLPLVA